MKDSPIIGIFLGIIVVLLIIVFSLGYQLNKNYKLSTQETSQRIKAEEKIEILNGQLNSLSLEVEDLKLRLKENKDLIISKDTYIEELKLEIEKINKLKETLEEDLKEELTKKNRF